MLDLAQLEANGLAGVAQLVRQGSYVPDSILLPAGLGQWDQAKAALTQWELSDLADTLAADVIENQQEYGGWKDLGDPAEVRNYLESAWQDNAMWSDLTGAEKDALVPIVVRKVGELLTD